MVAKDQLFPKLHFQNFNKPWKETKLGSVGNFLKGSNISKEQVTENGARKCIRYGELYTEYKEVVGQVRSKTNVELEGSVPSRKNDVLIPSSGETAIDIATSSCILEDNILLGGDINILRPHKNYDGVFLAYNIKNIQYKKIARVAQGQSVVHLYPSHLKKITLFLPEFDEQQKIASFFTAVDNWIENLRQQKEALEEYKRGMMQKIFSQQIRFKDKNGKDFSKWDTSPLAKVFSKVSDRNHNKKETRVLSNSATQGIVDQLEYFDKDIANQDNTGNYYVVEKNDFVYNPRISQSAPVGPIKRNRLHKGIMSPLYIVLRPKEVNVDYLEHFFETTFWHRYMYKIANYGARHDRISLSITEFYKMPIPIPSKAEQGKIAEFLNSLELLIANRKKSVGLAEEWKKGLLQQLFI